MIKHWQAAIVVDHKARKESLRKQRTKEEASLTIVMQDNHISLRFVRAKTCEGKGMHIPTEVQPCQARTSACGDLQELSSSFPVLPRPKEGHVEILTPAGSTRAEAADMTAR